MVSFVPGGPVARLPGLGSIYNIDASTSDDFIVKKMMEEAKEIDSVIKRISMDLDQGIHDAI